jgi:hypothetical protein
VRASASAFNFEAASAAALSAAAFAAASAAAFAVDASRAAWQAASQVGTKGVGSATGVLGVEGVEGAAITIPVASESFEIVPIELVAVASTLMYLSTSFVVNV